MKHNESVSQGVSGVSDAVTFARRKLNRQLFLNSYFVFLDVIITCMADCFFTVARINEARKKIGDY